MITIPAATEWLHLLGEPTRIRLLSLLAEEELSVAELTTITELGQSSVSTHLSRLKEAGLVRDRRVGTLSMYALSEGADREGAGQLWSMLSRTIEDRLLEADRERCTKVLEARKEEAWPESLAGEMDRHYSPGRTWESLARAFLGFLSLGDVLDIGCGDGAVAELIAPRARRVSALELNAKLAEAAKKRLARFSNAAVVAGDAEELPFPGEAFDHVLMLHVLVHVARPVRAITEAARVLRPAGKLLVVSLSSHKHTRDTEAYGHRHAGFSRRNSQHWPNAPDSFASTRRCSVANAVHRSSRFPRSWRKKCILHLCVVHLSKRAAST